MMKNVTKLHISCSRYSGFWLNMHFLSESTVDMSTLVFADAYFSIMLEVKLAANAIFKFCFFFENKFGTKFEIIACIFRNLKAPISLDCDCFATAGDRHREWVAKQSRKSRQ